ncbi:MAG: LysR family transcriptional regulator [Porticoccaceae bacterium]|jgi:DNA-binding transcriptional LysR family regulator|nr:LysR family transcriptional regulator [Porticoccaceae bacterium]MEA3299489.1 LysR family transcriptional regulator [Pseudomonadota bacterium]HLS99778.1 LysR family transcriptional regulator [Porticoccaceae bacterium]
MNVRHLTFRLLQVYVAVVRSGSISRAAAELHLTQPTVSQQLKRLAEAVGAELLEHRDGGLKPTFAGEELFRAAGDVLGRFEDFAGRLGDARAGVRGRFSIGVVTTAKYVLPRLLGPFCQHFPEVEVTIHVGNRGQVLERHHGGADDLYLFSHPPAGQHTLAGRFLANPLVLIAPEGHWAVGRAGLALEDLRDERFLFREPGSATRLVFENWLRDHRIQLSRIMQVESNEVIRMGVESGLGLAVLSEHTISAGSERLAVLDVAGFPLGSHWYLVCHGNRRLPAAARQFVRYVDSHLGECVDHRYIRNELGPILGHLAAQE